MVQLVMLMIQLREMIQMKVCRDFKFRQRLQNADGTSCSGGNSVTGASAEDVFFHFLSDVTWQFESNENME